MPIPQKISIEWLSDCFSDCETCGSSWADGARVKFDGGVVFEFIPVAHCTGGDHMTESEVYLKVFELLGIEEVEIA